MEVKLDKRYPVAAGVDAAWAVLADVRATAACMPGAQITEQVDATHYKGVVKSKVGPASMTFNGEIEVLGLDAASKAMTMLGKGADKSGSSASMNLAARVEPGDAPGSSVLAGTATIIVSGKLAQFGSRLLVPVSDAMLAQFADNFRAAAAAVPAAVAPAPAREQAAAEAESHAEAVIAAAVGVSAMAPAAGPNPVAASSAATVAAAPVVVPGAVPIAPPAPVRELNALGLLWSVFKSWVAGLFGRKT